MGMEEPRGQGQKRVAGRVDGSSKSGVSPSPEIHSRRPSLPGLFCCFSTSPRFLKILSSVYTSYFKLRQAVVFIHSRPTLSLEKLADWLLRLAQFWLVKPLRRQIVRNDVEGIWLSQSNFVYDNPRPPQLP